MKKILALFLCVLLTVGLFACGGETESETSTSASTEATEAPTSALVETPADIETAPTEEVHDHLHINYKGLSSRSVTLDDIKAAEGREPDFEFTAGDTTYYVYNNVTLDELTFSQVQFSFSDSSLRVSCTSSTQTDPSEAVSAWNTALSAIYGTPSESGGNYTWSDGSGNYITLCAINETTAQLAFYLCR